MLALAVFASTLAAACPANREQARDTRDGAPARHRRGEGGADDVRRAAHLEALGRLLAGGGRPVCRTLGQYRRLRCGDWWDEDPSSPTYNSFQHVRCGTKPPFGGANEGMWEQPRAYPFLAVIEFNTRPVVPGRGSGIFLHTQTGGPTIGCISLRKAQLRTVLRWLRPGDSPVITIGTTAQLR